MANSTETAAQRRREYFRRWYESEHGRQVIQRGRDRRAVQRAQSLMRQFGIAGAENLDELIDLLTRGGDLGVGD